MSNCRNTDSAHIVTEVENLSSRCMNGSNADTTQNNFIFPAPPIGGLPISQDRLDRMKLVRDSTIPIILPSVKNILAHTMFKIIIGYTNLGTEEIQSAFSLPQMPIWLSNQQNIIAILLKKN